MRSGSKFPGRPHLVDVLRHHPLISEAHPDDVTARPPRVSQTAPTRPAIVRTCLGRSHDAPESMWKRSITSVTNLTGGWVRILGCVTTGMMAGGRR